MTELVIRSEETEQGWDVPEKTTVRNGRIRGSIRIFRQGVNGEAPKVRESFHHEGHTARAQAAAPKRIVLEDLQIEADHRIPLYLGPGVTGVTVRNCTFTGGSRPRTISGKSTRPEPSGVFRRLLKNGCNCMGKIDIIN